MAEDYEQRANEAERELADMEERSERVEEHIEQARKDLKEESEDELPPPDPTETD
jgi:ribosomal protein S15P/S13E